MKKKSEKKVMYLTEVDEKLFEKDVLKATKMINLFRKDYKKFMTKLIKENLQTRMHTIDVLLQAFIHDGRLPTYIVFGMLKNIENNLMNIKTFIPQTPKKEVSYVG